MTADVLVPAGTVDVDRTGPTDLMYAPRLKREAVRYTGFYTSAAVAEQGQVQLSLRDLGRAHNWELLLNKTRRRQLEG